MASESGDVVEGTRERLSRTVWLAVDLGRHEVALYGVSE